MKVLITGITGMVGSHLAEYLVSSFPETEVHGLVRWRSPLRNIQKILPRLTLHQDKNERDYEAPIVSVSLGLPAVFLFGGSRRADPVLRVPLAHGDVVVFGGPARLRYHGVRALKEGRHPLLGGHRINLTFRKAA